MPPIPNLPQQKADVAAKEAAHIAASNFAAGAMASFALTKADLDSAAQDGTLKKLLDTGWQAWWYAYSGIIAALKNPAWADPAAGQAPPAPPLPSPPVTPPVPAPPVTPVA